MLPTRLFTRTAPLWPLAVALLIAFAWSAVTPASADHVEPNDFAPEQEQPIDAKPADPQPSDSELSAGLAVRYWQIYVRDIKEIADLVGRRKAKPGPDLANLDSHVGDGVVLTSKQRDGIGAEISGYIKFDNPGTYRFVANSNDGIRFMLAGELLFEDPDIHGVEQVSLVHILSPAQPGSSHAATIEVVGKAALDDLGAQLEGLAGDPGLEPRTVVGDRAPRRLITVPARKAGLLGRRDPGCVSKVVEIGFGASPSGLSFAAVRPRGQGFRRRLADRGFPIHRLCASGFGRKRGAPRGASALFRDTAARSVF